MTQAKKELKTIRKTPRKDYGQNFLSNKIKIEKIANYIIGKNIGNVVEIGPGLGAITDQLINSYKNLNIKCIEKDKELFKILKNKYKNKKNFDILNKDILNYDLGVHGNAKTLIFGNLPYNISTKILMNFCDSLLQTQTEGLFMFQKEVAEKIIAKKLKNNQLSCKIKCFFDIKEILRLNQSDFWPPPKIKSTLLLFTPKEINFDKNRLKELNHFFNIAFQSNRKKLFNNLRNEYDKLLLEKIFGALKLDLSHRPENIYPEQYLEIFHSL